MVVVEERQEARNAFTGMNAFRCPDVTHAGCSSNTRRAAATRAAMPCALRKRRQHHGGATTYPPGHSVFHEPQRKGCGSSVVVI